MDQGALERIYQKYKDNIFAIGFNYFKSSTEADDVVQETFFKLVKSKKEFESEEHLRNWLIRVAVNECKRVTLSSWIKRKVPLEDYVETLAFTIPEQSEIFLEVMKLPAKYRQVVHLYYYEDYKVKEIADFLEVSETTVTTRLQRGRKKLKERLLEAWEDEQE